MREIILNLLNNAVKFTKKGEVFLRVDLLNQSDERYRVRFSVKDSGIGIAKEHQEIIFDRFRQADPSIGERFGGTGLGLAICKKAIELMGSKIRVSSTLGEGSLFYFDLSLKKGSKLAVDEELLSLLKDKRILVLDANENVRFIFSEDRKLVSGLDFAQNMDQACEKIRAAIEADAKYSLVIWNDWKFENSGKGCSIPDYKKEGKVDHEVIMLPIFDSGEIDCTVDGQRAHYENILNRPVQRTKLFEVLRMVFFPNEFGETTSFGQKKNSIEISIDNYIDFKILVVDDIEDNRFIIRNFLKISWINQRLSFMKPPMV